MSSNVFSDGTEVLKTVPSFSVTQLKSPCRWANRVVFWSCKHHPTSKDHRPLPEFHGSFWISGFQIEHVRVIQHSPSNFGKPVYVYVAKHKMILCLNGILGEGCILDIIVFLDPAFTDTDRNFWSWLCWGASSSDTTPCGVVSDYLEKHRHRTYLGLHRTPAKSWFCDHGQVASQPSEVISSFIQWGEQPYLLCKCVCEN